eukprot:14191446-Alexandrium_andersonii.AAC.1
MTVQVLAQLAAAVEIEAAVERLARQLRREGWSPTVETDSLRPGTHPSMVGPQVQQVLLVRISLSGPGSSLRLRAAASLLRRHERMLPEEGLVS